MRTSIRAIGPYKAKDPVFILSTEFTPLPPEDSHVSTSPSLGEWAGFTVLIPPGVCFVWSFTYLILQDFAGGSLED